MRPTARRTTFVARHLYDARLDACIQSLPFHLRAPARTHVPAILGRHALTTTCLRMSIPVRFEATAFCRRTILRHDKRHVDL